MLYDILIVDDDFSSNSPLKVGDNAYELLRDFKRDNFRATWTTGEQDDLKKLGHVELSTIKYIFCDLHLKGISQRSSYKEINSKIMGILDKIKDNIKSKNITIFINSKFINYKNYNKNGFNDLKLKLKKDIYCKYKLKKINKKNILSDYKKKVLEKTVIEIHAKILIINKAIEIESIFDKKLKIQNFFRNKINFNMKFKVFTDKFLSSSSDKNIRLEIELLQQIRNKIAHSPMGDLEKINKKMSSIFWKIVSSKKNDPIKFEDLKSLSKYIKSVDDLCDRLREY